MIPGQFDYVRPGNLDETLRILKDREGEAKLLSGGYSLIPLIKLRLAQPALLVDLRDVGGLDGITLTDDYLSIGARATHRQIHEADVVRDTYPLLHDVTATIGDPQVRNWGTIGGSVAHADPASDWPAVLSPPTPRSSAAARPASARSRPATSSSARSRPPSSRPKCSPRSASPSSAGAGWRLREARAQGRRLRDGRGRGDRPARCRRQHRRVRDRPHWRRRRAVRGDRCRGILAGNAPTDDLFRRPAPQRAQSSPVVTSADRSNTSGRWPRS